VSLSQAAPAAVEHDQLQVRTDYEALLGGEQTVDPLGTRLGLEAKQTSLDSADGAGLPSRHPFGRPPRPTLARKDARRRFRCVPN
jgi:hypothetical protein